MRWLREVPAEGDGDSVRSGVEIKVETKITLDVATVANAFCEMSDEQQAQFFIEAAKLATAWNDGRGATGMQWWYVGRHLRNCACATEEARDMVREIVQSMDYQDNSEAAA